MAGTPAARRRATVGSSSCPDPAATPPLPPSGKRKTPPSSSRKRGTKRKEEQNDGSNVARVLDNVQGFGADEADTPVSRGYFEAKLRSSAKKSSRKIGDINVVEEQDLREALKNLAPKHEAERSLLLSSYKASYERWHFQLKWGFGLLMYGFGSKRHLLEDFASTALDDGPVVVINGYLPTINFKEVASTLAQALGSTKTSQSLDELLSFITDYEGDLVVYLIVHNIDGPGLREEGMQQLLARLAACEAIHMVASIDNINAPLLWDKRMANTQFNWWWHHTPTYAAYTVEAAFVPLILATSGVHKGVRSAILVLRSLTPNAQSVFKVLAEHQLANPDDEGLTQHQLYTKCRERFLVSSELTLRSHLTEFRDHQLVRLRKGSDGQDCLFVNLAADALTKLVADLENNK